MRTDILFYDGAGTGELKIPAAEECDCAAQGAGRKKTRSSP